MPTIKLPEPYAISLARQATRDSLLSHGEECIVLQMYHVGEDEGTAARCPVCFDDIYKQSEKANCTNCFGTTFAGGVKSAARVWGLFTDHVVAEQIGQNGVWTPDQRDVQIEPFPLLTEHDFLVRVRVWDSTHRPIEIEGFYGIQQVTRNSLRTGNRFGQWRWDVVGQKATITELQKNSPICAYPVVGVDFPGSPLSRGVTPPAVNLGGSIGPIGTLPSASGGQRGPKGDRGSKWFQGTDVPTSFADEQDGDMYLNVSNGDVWTFYGGWNLVGNIRGVQGPNGGEVFTEVVDSALQDGERVTYDLSEVAKDSMYVKVTRNGLIETPGIGYYATTTQVVFTTPPLSSDVILFSYPT